MSPWKNWCSPPNRWTCNDANDRRFLRFCEAKGSTWKVVNQTTDEESFPPTVEPPSGGEIPFREEEIPFGEKFPLRGRTSPSGGVIPLGTRRSPSGGGVPLREEEFPSGGVVPRPGD